MFIRKLPADPDEMWIKLGNIVDLSPFQPRWNEIAAKLGFITDKSLRAFHARRRRRSSNWKTIVEILNVLGCNLYMLVPENTDDLEEEEILKEAISITTSWSRLNEKDRKLVKVMISRLRKDSGTEPREPLITTL